MLRLKTYQGKRRWVVPGHGGGTHHPRMINEYGRTGVDSMSACDLRNATSVGRVLMARRGRVILITASRARFGRGSNLLYAPETRTQLGILGQFPKMASLAHHLGARSYNVAPFPRDNILPRHCVRSRERSHHKPVGGLPPCDVNPVLH